METQNFVITNMNTSPTYVNEYVGTLEIGITHPN